MNDMNGMNDMEKPQVCGIGWREWLSLPELGIGPIKAKVDTGARTSALHAFYTERFERDGAAWVRFGVHPEQGKSQQEVHCEAPIHDLRTVKDSGGHNELRPVIRTQLHFNGDLRPIELTLTDRDSMRFRMLLGRTALRQGFLVYPGKSFMLGGTRDLPPENQ